MLSQGALVQNSKRYQERAEFDVLLEQGIQHHQKQDFAAALDAFNKAISLRQDNGEVFYFRGRAHEGLNNNELALEDYSKAITLKLTLERRAEVHTRKGIVLLEMDRSKEALRVLDDASRLMVGKASLLPLLMKSALYYYNRGVANWREKKLNEAKADFFFSVKLKSNKFDPYYSLSRVCFELNQKEKSIEYLIKALMEALKMEQNNNIKKCYLLLKKHENTAVNKYIQSLNLDPQQPDTYFFWSHIFNAQEEDVKAIEYLLKALLVALQSEHVEDKKIKQYYSSFKKYATIDILVAAINTTFFSEAELQYLYDQCQDENSALGKLYIADGLGIASRIAEHRKNAPQSEPMQFVARELNAFFKLSTNIPTGSTSEYYLQQAYTK